MKILRGLYHFLLFLVVSWTVHSSFIFICLILPASENKYVELDTFFFWNFYLLGALDFHEFIQELTYLWHNWSDPLIFREFWPFLIYVAIVNGLAVYIWCNKQTTLSACILALAPCIAGLDLALVFDDYRLLFFGMIGIVVFYVILYNLNDYRKRRYPQLTLPEWLEWRRPNMVPSLKPLARKLGIC